MAYAKEGKRVEGGEFTVLSAEATADGPTNVLVDILYTRAPGTTRSASGAVIETSAGGKKAAMQMRTLRRNIGWITRGIRFPNGPQ
jgi:hypothetical protein